MRLDVPVLALAAAAGLFGISVAAAQTPPPAAQPPFAVPPFKNLKVLPKDIARADLQASMKFFSQSLGVRCTYCHVGTEGQPLSTFDFASDAKDHKKIARDMMRLTQHINTDHLPAIMGRPDAKVTCFTCHRGATKPATDLPAPPPQPASAPASPAPGKSERGA
ncbi:MAG: hypothetical protein QOD54_1265 [Sphingomonadales bacterium]|jgi:hypothetical protein|nr:hypothetical protein [Sphingomonadales bacterium]